MLVRQVHVFVLTNGIYEYQRYLDACDAIAQQLGDDSLLGHFYACRGHIQFMAGLAREAAETLREAAALCERAGNFQGAGHAYAHLQWAQLQKGEYEDVLKLEAAALGSLARAPEMRLLVYSLTASAWACAMLGRWDPGLEKGKTSLQESEQARDASLMCFTYAFSFALVYRHQGAIEQAIDSGRRAVEHSQTPAERQWAEVFYAWALAARDPVAAADLLAPIVSFYRSAGLDWPEAFAIVPFGEACLLAGRLPEARESLERAMELGERLEMRLIATPAERLLGEVMLADGRPDSLERAGHHFERAMAGLEKSRAENELALAWAGYGRLQARLGRPEQARDYLTKALATFERLGTLREPERVRAAVAALA
jgi:tetratricopeptide (TPR) repeat protein